MKFVISNNKGQAKQHEVEDASGTYGLKIGDTFSGDVIGLEGYELVIRGGSDTAGFPMRRDVQGLARKRIYTTKGIGVKVKKKGERVRKTVRGNTISERISQVNVLITKIGKEDMFAEAKPEEAAEGGAPAEDAKKE